MRKLLSAVASLLMMSVPALAVTDINPADAAAKVESGEIVLIDIRTPPEWAQTGVAAPAHALDMTNPKFLVDLQALLAANPGKAPAFICRTGNRTTYPQQALQEMGFSNVYNVKEGMAGSGAGPGWVQRGLPVQDCRTC